ncbi:hypothetical protein CKA32_003214 [Geitlerinema sp. FC II]|nr:hypothetical protein CKA32_003214 [Geitlerinema sp. FC II]
MTIYIFGEGSTEKTICKKLVKLVGFKAECIPAGGKNNLNKKVVETIEPLLGVGEVRCVIVRDLDEGETESRLCQSITDAFERALQRRDIPGITLKLSPHETHLNVYVLYQSNIDLRLAVHIANHRWKPDFANCTTDDYLLRLALQSTVLIKLSDKLGITSKKLSEKITSELPNLLQVNGITLPEAKNYLQLYSAINKFSNLRDFISKIIENADKTEIREVFLSLIAAFEFVEGA